LTFNHGGWVVMGERRASTLLPLALLLAWGCAVDEVPPVVTPIEGGVDTPRSDANTADSPMDRPTSDQGLRDASGDGQVTDTPADVTSDQRSNAADVSIDAPREDVSAPSDGLTLDEGSSPLDAEARDEGRRLDGSVDAGPDGPFGSDADARGATQDGGADAAPDSPVDAVGDSPGDGAVERDGEVASAMGWTVAPATVCTSAALAAFCQEDLATGNFIVQAMGGCPALSLATLWFPRGADFFAPDAGSYTALPDEGTPADVPQGRVVVQLDLMDPLWWALSGTVEVTIVDGRPDIRFDALPATSGTPTSTMSGHLVCPPAAVDP
jgi:hypothetical protein